jgi:hypothetical protein
MIHHYTFVRVRTVRLAGADHTIRRLPLLARQDISADNVASRAVAGPGQSGPGWKVGRSCSRCVEEAR